MYLVAKGECHVFVGEESDNSNGNNRKKKKDRPTSLRPGAYFGEISLVYDCLCTAKVVAFKYCTLAMLTKEKFKDLTTQIPKLLESINKGIYDYDDKMLRFIKKSMGSVPYLRDLEEECMYDIIYSLQTQ